MTNPIVQTVLSATKAPAPPTLQKTGAMLSQGGTTTAPGTLSLITQPSDLTPLLAGAQTLASLTQTGGVATATLENTTIASGTYNSTTGLVTLTLTADVSVKQGDLVTVASATGTGSFASINGTFQAGAGSTGTTLTYTVAPSLTMTITGGNVNATTGLATNAQFLTTIAGSSIAAYNGTVLATVASATTFTYSIPSATASPATGTPTATPPSVAELVAMVTTFFAQGSQQSVYVLELGAGTPAQGVTYLPTWLAANPGIIYAFLVSRLWDSVAGFLTLMASYEALTSKLYFFITSTITNYVNYTKLMKCAFVMVEAPIVPASAPLEFDAAAAFYVLLNQAPSSTNRVPQMAFQFLYGVTPYPLPGNGSLLTTLAAANINYVGTGAEGGISTAVLFFGTTADGNDLLKWWYGIDWAQINSDITIANTVVNGSNNPSNPLLYNQDGINRLQASEASLMQSGVADGIVLGPVVLTQLDTATFNSNVQNGVYADQTPINAVPFLSYTAANPSDYSIGKYGGLSVALTPQLGFKQIVFNINVSSFVAGR
jgi:hypothetical protein